MRVGLYKRRKHPSAFCVLLFSVLLFIGISVLILIKMRPVFLDYAEKYSENMANTLVNEAIDEVYSDNRYNGLSEIKEGNIKTVETDTSKINTVIHGMRRSRIFIDRVDKFLFDDAVTVPEISDNDPQKRKNQNVDTVHFSPHYYDS